MTYQARCHCSRVALEFEGEIGDVLSCNCSICQRKGSLLWFLPRDQVKLLSPDDAASTYTFNQHRIRHRFCPVCGIHPYAEAADAQGRPMVAINVRCIEGIDLDALTVRHFDGRSI